MGLDLAHIRLALGIGFEEGVAWFSIDETHTPFAPQKSPRHRAVVLRRWGPGPIAWVYPRSTSSDVGYEHSPHCHRDEFSQCWIGETARIVLTYPLPVKHSELTQATYMCAEPDALVTDAVLAAVCPS